jgi:transcription antitermination factor NusG
MIGERTGGTTMLNGQHVADWYVIYTRPHHEKTVARQLDDRCIETLLPTYPSVRRWKDRKKKIWQPAFPGYVFVHMLQQDRFRILQLPGVVRFVTFGGILAPVSKADLQALRLAAESEVAIEPHPYLEVGRRVEVWRGVLAGIRGLLVREKGSHRLVLSLNLIRRSVAVEVDANDVIPIAELEAQHRASRFWAESIRTESPEQGGEYGRI